MALVSARMVKVPGGEPRSISFPGENALGSYNA
jgi:hypothetical protein